MSNPNHWLSGDFDRTLTDAEQASVMNFLQKLEPADECMVNATCFVLGWVHYDDWLTLESHLTKHLPIDVSVKLTTEYQSLEGDGTEISYIGPKAAALELADINGEIVTLNERREVLLSKIGGGV